jgi:hypothetical protein
MAYRCSGEIHFVVSRSQVRFLTWSKNISIEFFRTFLQCVPESVKKYLKINNDHFLTTPCSFFVHNRTFRLQCLKSPITYPSIYGIYGSTALVDLGRFFSFFIYTELVELLGREISPSQGRYLHTGQHKHRINAHRHPCLEWDSNPRSQCSSGRRRFMP